MYYFLCFTTLVVTVDQVMPGQRITCHLKVISVALTLERHRYEGEDLIREAHVVAGDSTGILELVARNEQLDIIKEGAVITIRNAFSRAFDRNKGQKQDEKGNRIFDDHIRVEIDKWAKVEPSKEVIASVKESNNISDTEWERVQPAHNQQSFRGNNRRGGRGGRRGGFRGRQ